MAASSCILNFNAGLSFTTRVLRYSGQNWPSLLVMLEQHGRSHPIIPGGAAEQWTVCDPGQSTAASAGPRRKKKKRRGGFYIRRPGYSYLLIFEEFYRKSTVATLLWHSADRKEGSVVFIRWTRKFTKSDGYLRNELHFKRTESVRHFSGLSKSMGQDRYLVGFFHKLSAWREASWSPRKIEGHKEKKPQSKESRQ